MTHKDILKDLKAKKYQPIYFLHGEEPYYIDLISDYIEENVLNEGEKAFNQMVLYGKEIDFKMIVDEARQFPMMSERRVIIVKEAQNMSDIANLATYVERPSPQAIVVLCYKYKKLDKRTKFAKTIEANGVVFESKKLYDNQVADWISAYIKDKGVDVVPDAAHRLSEYLGTDLSVVINEVEKLLLSYPGIQKVSVQHVDEQINMSKEFNVFDLQKALGKRDFSMSSRIINYFQSNPAAGELVPTLSNLYSYFNKLIIIASHSKSSPNDLARMIGVPSPYIAQEYISAARNYSLPHLKEILIALKYADLHSKGVGMRKATAGEIFKDLIVVCMHGRRAV
jgi:DNA polymerase III subunit delta